MKNVNTFNGEGDVIRSKSFDELGNLVFDEKINPKTNHVKTMLRSEGQVINQEMLGSVLLRKQVADLEGNISYSYEFDPTRGKEVITDLRDGMTLLTKKVNGEETFKMVKLPNGDETRVAKDTIQGTTNTFEGGIIKYADGSVSKGCAKFKKLTITDDKTQRSRVFELVKPDGRTIYSYKEYDDLGKQIGETRLLHSESMRAILDRTYGWYE